MQPAASYVSLGSRPPGERLVTLPPGIRRPYRQLGRPATNRLSNILAPNPASTLRHGTSTITLSDRTTSLTTSSAPISPASSTQQKIPSAGAFQIAPTSWQQTYSQFGSPHTVNSSSSSGRTVRVPSPQSQQLRTILNYESRETKLPPQIVSQLDNAYAEFKKAHSGFTHKF